jgi:hypothetical protein
MKKCNKIKKIAIAAVMASAISAQMLAASISADSTLTLYYYNGVYYSSQAYASNLAGYTVSASSINTSSLTNYWYNSYTGGYYSSYSDARNASSSGSVTQPYATTSSTNTASGTNRYYNASKGLYYPNYSSAVSASNNSKDVTTFSTTTPKAYFCMTNGIYYDTLAEAEAIAGSAYVIRITNVSSTSSTSASDRYVIRYYSSDSGDYYLSYSEALSHSTSSSNISSTKVYTYDYWFCKENGLFYSTKSQALSHTINNDESMVEYVNSSYYNNYNYNYSYYNGSYPYYYNGNSDLYYYYSSMGYYPYYSNYYNYYNYGYPYYNSTSSTIFTGSAANGDPYISGNKKKAGWTYIANVVNDANDGATVKVAMNKATTITKSVLSELKAKDVDLVLTMSNGAKWTINGDDISTAKDTDLTVQYSNYAIPDALVKKASSGAVSTAQIKLGDNTSFGFSASVTLSFSTRRAGCTANLYQYDASSKSLTLIDSTTISNSGSATFNNISNGGDFLIIIK